MKRTGNRTWNTQLVYILGNFPFVMVVKIGITGNMKRRLSQIDKSAPGNDRVLFRMKIWGAYYLEQLVHFLCYPLRVYHFRELGGLNLGAYLLVGLLILSLPMFLDAPPEVAYLPFGNWLIASFLPWGSGRTERFLFPAAIIALAVFLLAWVVEKTAWVLFVAFLIWLLCGSPNWLQ